MIKKTKRVLRECGACHTRRLYLPNATRCDVVTKNAFGRVSCLGPLAPVVRVKYQPPPGDELRKAIARAVETAQQVDPEIVAIADDVRAKAAKSREHADARLLEALSDLKRVTARIHKWQRKASYYAKRASVTNSDVARVRARRKTTKS